MIENILAPLSGYDRKGVRCRQCGRVAYYDYVPFSLSNAAHQLPCGHGAALRFYEAVEDITPGEIGYDGPGWYFWEKTETPNMVIYHAYGPYPDKETCEVAQEKFSLAVRALQSAAPGGRGMYIHLTEKKP